MAFLSWTPESENPVRTIGRHTERVNQITFTSSGDVLVSCSGVPRVYDDQYTVVEPENPGTVKVWNFESGNSFSLESRDDAQRVFSEVTTSPNGRKVASVSTRGTVETWTLRTTGEAKRNLTRHFGVRSSSIAFKGNKELLLGSSDNVITVIRLEEDDSLTTFHGHSGEVTSLAGGANANFFVSGSRDHTVKAWDLTR